MNIRIGYDKAGAHADHHGQRIGMSRDEVINNLGTIAKSGRANFSRTCPATSQRTANLIGQFERGFLFFVYRRGQGDGVDAPRR